MTTTDTERPHVATPFARHIAIVDPALNSDSIIAANVPSGPVLIDGVMVPRVTAAMGVQWDHRGAVVVTLAVQPDAIRITERNLFLGNHGVEVNVMCPVDPIGDLTDHPFWQDESPVKPVDVYCARLSIVEADTDLDAVFAT